MLTFGVMEIVNVLKFVDSSSWGWDPGGEGRTRYMLRNFVFYASRVTRYSNGTATRTWMSSLSFNEGLISGWDGVQIVIGSLYEGILEASRINY